MMEVCKWEMDRRRWSKIEPCSHESQGCQVQVEDAQALQTNGAQDRQSLGNKKI